MRYIVCLKQSAFPTPLPDAVDDFGIGDREPEFGSEFNSAADGGVDIRTKPGVGVPSRKIGSAGGGDGPFTDDGVEVDGVVEGGASLLDDDAKENESVVEDETENGVADESSRRVVKDRRQYSRYHRGNCPRFSSSAALSRK